MYKRDAEILLSDIMESIDKIFLYTKGMSFDDFTKDDRTIDVVVRNLEIIGEAANKVPEITKQKINTIEWYKIIGLRNVVIHEYFGVDLNIIWQIITNNLNPLKEAIKNYFKTL